MMETEGKIYEHYMKFLEAALKSVIAKKFPAILLFS